MSIHSAWLRQCREWSKRYDPVRPEMLNGSFHHYGFMRLLSEAMPSNAIVVADTGGNVIMMGHCFRSKLGQRIFTSNGNTPMGFAMCGAIGAHYAEPERPVVCIIGDGGMQMNIQELQTIKHCAIPLKLFVINNRILGNTKSYQRVNKKAELACGPDGYSTPDFALIARAYGISAHIIDSFFGFKNIIADGVLTDDYPYLFDVIHHDFCQYEPRMSRWDAGIEEMVPSLPEQDFKNSMIVPPLDGWKDRRG